MTHTNAAGECRDGDATRAAAAHDDGLDGILGASQRSVGLSRSVTAGGTGLYVARATWQAKAVLRVVRWLRRNREWAIRSLQQWAPGGVRTRTPERSRPWPAVEACPEKTMWPSPQLSCTPFPPISGPFACAWACVVRCPRPAPPSSGAPLPNGHRRRSATQNPAKSFGHLLIIDL